MMENSDHYKFIANSVQLKNIELVSLKCDKKDLDKMKNKKPIVEMNFKRIAKLLNETEVEIKLNTILEVKDLFTFNIIYKGICEKINPSLTEEELEEYAYTQVVPLLLPYVRELISNTMWRMNLPVFTIPTMDILSSYEENDTKGD